MAQIIFLVENILEQVLGDAAMGRGDIVVRPPIKSVVEGVKNRTQVAPHIEPPIAHKHRLVELRAVGTQERSLTAVNVAVVPSLKASVMFSNEIIRFWTVKQRHYSFLVLHDKSVSELD
jgi:hypothetical protein